MQASATAATLLSMLDDYDRLLSSNSNFMLGEYHHLRRILSLSCNVVTPISAPRWAALSHRTPLRRRAVDQVGAVVERRQGRAGLLRVQCKRAAPHPPFPLRLLSKASKKRGCAQYDGTIFTRYATEKGDAGLDSDFGDSGPTAFAEDRVLLAPDDFNVNGPWPHRCQGEIPHDPAADVFGRPSPMIIIHLSHHCCCYHCRHLGAFLSRFQR